MVPLVVLVLLASGGLAAAATPPETTIRDCNSYAIAPSGLTIACADANFGLAGLHWANWGSAAAKGTGVARANDCNPYCAAGHFHDYPVVATADQLRTCLGGRRQYTRLSLAYTGSAPASVRSTSTISLPCTWGGEGAALAWKIVGKTVVLSGAGWQRGGGCQPTVTLSIDGKPFATAKLDARAGFRVTTSLPAPAPVIVARQSCHSAAVGARFYEAAATI